MSQLNSLGFFERALRRSPRKRAEMTGEAAMKHVLLFEDERGFSEKIGYFLAGRGYQVIVAERLQAARRLVEHGGMDLVVADVRDLCSLGSEVIRRATQKGVQIFVTGTNSSAFRQPQE